MAKNGIAGTHGSHGGFAEGIVLKIRIATRLICITITCLFYTKARTVLVACLGLFVSFYSHENPTAVKMDSSSIKDIPAVIHLGAYAIHTPMIDVPYHELLRLFHQADLSPIFPLCLYLNYRLRATPCRKLHLEKGFPTLEF